ncbi:unnamed protein product, partial [Tilletia controversa]
DLPKMDNLNQVDNVGQGAQGTSTTHARQDHAGVEDLETLALFLQRTQDLSRSEAVDKAAQLYISSKIKSESGSDRVPTPAPKDWDVAFKDHKKIAGNITKLTNDNFIVWLMKFRNLINNVPRAQEHLEGIEHDLDFPDRPMRTAHYDTDLDIELGRVLLQTLDEDVSLILLPHHTLGETRASMLFNILRKSLIRDDPASQDRVRDTIQNFKQKDRDVTSLAKVFRYYFTYSTLLGNPISDAEQCRYLLNSLHSRYDVFKQSAAFHRSTSDGKNAGFEYFVRQLLLAEASKEGGTSTEQAFAVALQASGSSVPLGQALVASASSSKSGQSKQLGPKFTKSRGRGGSQAGRGGNRPANSCRRCHQMGHYAGDCKLSWDDAMSSKHQNPVATSNTVALATQEQQALYTAQRQD